MVIQNVLGLALKNSENKERVKVQFSDGEIAQLRAIKERLMRTVVFMKQYDSVFTKKKRLASWLKRVKKAEKTKEISYTNPQGRKLEKIVDSLGRGEVASVTSRAFLSGLGSLASIYSAK